MSSPPSKRQTLSMEATRLLNDQRTSILTISNSITNLKKRGRANITVQLLQRKLVTLEKEWEVLKARHGEITSVIPVEQAESLDYFILDEFSNAQDKCDEAIAYVTAELEKLSPAPVAQPAAAPASVADPSGGTSIKLPEQTLPRYSGDPTDWQHFADLFSAAVIRNKTLSNGQRLQYLNSCLEGEAHAAISNLAITDRNFETAWTELQSRFYNENVIVTNLMAPFRTLRTIREDDLESIQQVTIDLKQSVTALEKFGYEPDKGIPYLPYLIITKMHPDLKKSWDKSCKEPKKFPTWEELYSFLVNLTTPLLVDKAIVRRNDRSEKAAKATGRNSKNTVRIHNATVAETTHKNVSCTLCKERHSLFECKKYKNLNAREKLLVVETSQYCVACLSTDHTVSRCESGATCEKCGAAHHKSLHYERPEKSNHNAGAKGRKFSHQKRSNESASQNTPRPNNQRRTQKPSTPATVNSHCGSTTGQCERSVLLATALVKIYGKDGTSRVARALLDQGSEASFITSSLVNDLRLHREKSHAIIKGLGGGRGRTITHSVDIRLGSKDETSPKYIAKAFVVPTITSYVPPAIQTRLEHAWENLKLADPQPGSDQEIEILIGADLFAIILQDGVRRVTPDGLIAQETTLGWVLSGSVSAGNPRSRQLQTVHCTVLASLDKAIRRFWEIEDIPPQKILTPEEKECEEYFAKTVTRDKTGRFIVRLPFRVPRPEEMLGESLHIALSALSRLRRKLDVDPTVLREYGEFLAEYESLNHMTRLPSLDKKRLYIPHRAVLRTESVTTKLRVVFNATSVTASGRSLNDLLHVGPKLQQDITAILMNWRLHQYVLVADIEKMFRQILIAPEERRFQCIVWREPESEKLLAFELNTVTYGTACAPYLSMRTLLELAKVEGQNFPLAVPVLTKDVYVDDVFMSAPEKNALEKIRLEVCELLRKGGFQLRKWAGNSPDLLKNIPQGAHSHAVDLTLFEDSELKVLGLRWIPSGDYFYFNLLRFQPSTAAPTKRELFSEIAKLYDPLGWLSPVVVRAKILMQAQWLEKIHWDEHVSAVTHRTWNNFCEDWSKLNDLKIPRWVQIRGDTTSVEVHGFCDASNAAYSAVAYIRVSNADNETNSSLLMAKTRVAPLKTLTIPTLELYGAVLLTDLIVHVQKHLSVKIERVVCWCDNKTVLAWLRKHPSTWKILVANRVSKVQTALPNAEWRYVPSRENPADLNSRGVDADELLRSRLWLSGPSWLNETEAKWPTVSEISETNEEKRIAHVHVGNQQKEWEFLLRFSKWSRLLRVTAYCLRFYRMLKGERKSESSFSLNPTELQDATERIARHLQRNFFEEEVRCLEKNRTIPKNSKILKLSPFLDKNGVLRVGGRLEKSILPWETKFPILLPKHYVSTLIIRQCHLNTLHGGMQLTIHTVRQRFWIISCRNLTRTVINNCMRCTRWKARTMVQKMQSLLPERCRPSRAFQNCGIDYAGPYRVRDSSGRGKTAHKAYIAVFICYATRAVHVELVSDYSTSSFLAAFERFVSRRGIPASIFSDNGTNFVGAHRELMREFNRSYSSKEMRDRCSELHIKWRFNPPAAPHFGGMQEAGVKSVKYHLKRIIGEFTPTIEEMQTLLCKIEASLNSRPIAPLTDDPDDYAALTPGHFLTGAPLNALPWPSVENEHVTRLTRWRALQKFHEQLWRHWTRDYLVQLQNRYKWSTTEVQLKTNDVVLVENPLLPPNQWELGRIEQVFPDEKGNVRVVKVRTATNTYTRPITRMCKLPVDEPIPVNVNNTHDG